jgi:hypothetical protein
MSDASYKNIDFERMLSDLGQALERNKARTDPGSMPATASAPAASAPSDDALNRIDQRRAAMGMKPLGAIGAPGGANQRTMGAIPGAPGNMSPADAQTSAQLDATQTTGAGGVPYGHAPSAMSPQDMQTLAALNRIQTTGPGGVPFGSLPPGEAAPVAPPPPAIAAQLAGASAQPNAMSAPPTPYPTPVPPPDASGLAAYAQLNR